MLCHSGISLIDLIFTHIGTISLVGAVIAWISHMAYYKYYGYKLTLNATLAKVVSGAAVPPAIAMLGAAFDPPDLLGCVSDLGLYIFIGSVSVIWITWTVLFPAGKEQAPQPLA
jgi:hypothetical protein